MTVRCTEAETGAAGLATQAAAQGAVVRHLRSELSRRDATRNRDASRAQEELAELREQARQSAESLQQAEGQVAEERAARARLAARLDEALADAQTFDESRRTLNDEIRRVNARAAVVEVEAGRARDLSEQVGELSGRIVGLEAEIATRKQQTAADAATATSLKDLRRENQRLQMLLDASLSVENTAVVRVQERATALAATVTSLETELAAAREASGHSGRIREQLAERDEALRQAVTRLAVLEGVGTELDTERQRVARLEKLVDEYEARERQQLGDLSALFEVDANRQRQQIATLEALVRDRDEQLAALRSSLVTGDPETPGPVVGGETVR
jgi:chromosome segregation ATPase